MKESKQWSETELLDFKKRWQAITIPVNIKIENRQMALDLAKCHQILTRAGKIALGDCICRTTLQNCDLPRKTCIFFDDRAEMVVKQGRAEWITQEQAKEIVSMTQGQGLVHLAMYQTASEARFPSEICSCCPCCCQALQGLQKMNMKGLVKKNDLVATFDPETCSQCGTCVDRCQFGARMLDSNNNIVFRENLCFGCGLCVTTCPENSIKLVSR
ncbi:MAG: 4Fe-4S binding protein [Candidatus Odinarchaeota archaeon]